MPLSKAKSGPDPGAVLAWQILAPITALFFILVVFSGLAARQFFEPLAMQRDLLRAERYAKFSAVVFSERLNDRTPQELTEEFHRAGLHTLEFLPPESTPAWTSPRFLDAGPFVEAWSAVTSADGTPLGAITLRRQADAFVFVTQAIRAFALAACVTFALLFAFAWFLLKRRVTNRLRSLMQEVGPAMTTPEPGSDVVQQTRMTVAEGFAREQKKTAPMQHLLDGHTEMACTSTPEGTLLAMNSAYSRFFGKSREQLVGTNYLDLIPPADRNDAIASVRKLSRQNPVSVAEHRVVLADGSIRWVRWRDTASFAGGGNATEILSFGSDITTEKELAAEIDGLRLAFDQMQSLAETGSLTWDLAADVMEWTPETRRLLGLDASAPASMDGLLAVVAPDEVETVRRLFREAKERGRDFQHEFRAVLPDGSLRVLQSRGEVLADPKTKILNHLTCTLRDITALRDAEAATKRELRFREAIEQSIAAGISVSDENGRILFVNPAFCQMTGWSQSELVGTVAPYPYWPVEEMPAIRAAFEQALKGKTPQGGFELRFCRKDGSLLDVLVNVAPLLDSKEHQIGWLGAVTDISAIQQTRRELQATYERLRIAQDVAEFGIWDWNPVKDILHWDRQSFALFGYPDATNPKEVWVKANSEEEQERLTYELKRLIASGGTSGQDHLRVQWPDGSIHDILSTYVIVRDKAGHSTRVLGINRDVTEELEEEREFRSAQERLAAALEGGSFGTFEHLFGVGALNWNTANYELYGIDPGITDPEELFQAWKAVVGAEYAPLEQKISGLPVNKNVITYIFSITVPGTGEKHHINSSVFVERNKKGHPVRLVGISRRLD